MLKEFTGGAILAIEDNYLRRLNLRIFGGCDIVLPSGESIELQTRKARVAFAIIALSPNQTITREKLAGLLWSEVSEVKARTSLRQVLRLMKEALDQNADLVSATKEVIFLKKDAVEVDLLSCLDNATKGDFSFQIFKSKRIDETLFAGMEDLDEAFNSWLAVQRAQCRAHLVSAMEYHMGNGQRSEQVLFAATALQQLDPSHEPALRLIMQIEAEQGNSLAAINRYRHFEKMLLEEYDVLPEDTSKDLFDVILKGRHNVETGRKKTPRKAQEKLPIIAIIAEEEDRPDDKSFVLTGFISQLRGLLTRFRTWNVLTIPDNEEVNERIDYCLNIRRLFLNSRLMISVSLVENDNKAILWEEQLSIEIDDVLESRQTVARGLCGALNQYVSAHQLNDIRQSEPSNQSALEKWMLGQQLLQVWEPDTETRAEKLFEEALQESPNFSLVHCNLADVYNSRHIVYPGTFRETNIETKALRLARRAVALDPLEPRAHVTHGWSLALQNKHSQSITAFMRGHEINPSDPMIAMSAAHGLAICGALDDAERLAMAAFSSHPTPPWFFYGFDSNIRFLMDDLSGSVESADMSGEVAAYITGWKCAALGLLNDPASRRTADEFVSRVSETWTGSNPPEALEVVRWFTAIFPFANRVHSDRLREGLRLAGLPA